MRNQSARPLPAQTSGVEYSEMNTHRLRIWVRKGWVFWQAVNPDEPVALLDTPTVLRSRTREGVIAKARCRWGTQPSPWEEI